MATKNTTTLDEQFVKECKIIDLKYEYPGFTGTERYGIITTLSLDELNQKYGTLLDKYIPFLLLDEAFGRARAEFKRNNDKFLKRSLSDHQYSIDDEFEEHHSSLCVPDFTDVLIEECSEESPVKTALRSLTALQRQYVCRHIIDGVSLSQIAREVGKNAKTVNESYHAAIKKLKKLLGTPPN